MPKGGRRQGAGRPKGSKTKPKLTASELLPSAAQIRADVQARLGERSIRKKFKEIAAEETAREGWIRLEELYQQAQSRGDLKTAVYISELQLKYGQGTPIPRTEETVDVGEMIRRMAENRPEDGPGKPVEPRTWTVPIDDGPDLPVPPALEEVARKFLPPAPPLDPGIELDSTHLESTYRVPKPDAPEILTIELPLDASDGQRRQLEADVKAWGEDRQVVRVVERGDDGALREVDDWRSKS